MKYIPVILLATIMTACGCTSGDSMSDEARRFGIEDARELGNSNNENLLELQNRLLKIRAIETRLRQNGHQEAADIYITSFENTIKTEFPTLADKVGIDR